MKTKLSPSAPLNLCAPVGVTGTTLADLPDRRTVWEMRVDGSFLRWCGTLEQFRKDCEEYCDRSKGHWEKVTNTEFRFISPEEPKITHFKAVKKGVDSVVESSATLPASPVKDTPAGEPEWINIPGAEELRKEVQPGQKLIWRNAFRWMDDNGVLSNHYEMFSVQGLAADFGYEVVKDVGYAAIIVDKNYKGAPESAPTSPVDSVGGPEGMFHFMERSTKRCADHIDHDGELYGVIQCPEFALDVYAPIAMEMEAFKSTLRAFTGNAASHAAKDAKIKALTDALENALFLISEHADHLSAQAHPDQINAVCDNGSAALALPCAPLGS